ncbi:MAG TPA: hypothetical protein VHY84_14875 [Bryobacteraceae bacterium]|jgi:hypothetical protein|nr:hypothetical protein [Bryobacteraceae bacterium]
MKGRIKTGPSIEARFPGKDHDAEMHDAADFGAVMRGCEKPRDQNPFAGGIESIANEWMAWAWDLGWRQADFVGRCIAPEGAVR